MARGRHIKKGKSLFQVGHSDLGVGKAQNMFKTLTITYSSFGHLIYHYLSFLKVSSIFSLTGKWLMPCLFGLNLTLQVISHGNNADGGDTECIHYIPPVPATSLK